MAMAMAMANSVAALPTALRDAPGVFSRALATLAMVGALLVYASAAQAAATAVPVQLEELTWTELRERIRTGTTTVLVPIGGTEQNGPHIVLGKHNVRARLLAARVAEKLGNAVVAPVIAYVPEGAVSPPVAHMRYPGTISIPDAAFEAMLEGTARSFRQHGFRDVVFLGDHGGYLKNLERVAAKLDREWAGQPGCKVHALLDYYRSTQTTYVDALKGRGYGDAEIGTHAGLADTSLALAIDPALVRQQGLAQSRYGSADGVAGDPRKSSAELGQLGIDAVVAVSVRQIQALAAAHRPTP
jgi:creatinine amidohydrolase